jgi:hypothetical protein
VRVHKSASKCRKKPTSPTLTLHLLPTFPPTTESLSLNLEFATDVYGHNSNYSLNMPKGPSQVTPRSYARQAAGLWTVIDATEDSVTPRGGRGKENVGDVGANSRMTPRGTGFRAIPTAQSVGIRHFVRRMSKDCGAGSYARHTACSLRKSGVQEPPKQLEGAGTTPKDAEIRKLKGLLAATISENEER